jgi:hypothetical protein
MYERNVLNFGKIGDNAAYTPSGRSEHPFGETDGGAPTSPPSARTRLIYARCRLCRRVSVRAHG